MNPKKSPNTRHSGKPPAPAPAEPLIAGQSIELLKELHILTREGKLNQDSRRKLKQVRHLYQFIEPLLVHLQEAQITSVNCCKKGSDIRCPVTVGCVCESFPVFPFRTVFVRRPEARS